jgi:cytosine deaminase
MHSVSATASARCELARMMDLLAEAGIGIISAVPGDIRFPADVRACSTMACSCAVASDSLRDTWNPHGNGDMLERCWLLSWRSNCRTDAELDGCPRHGYEARRRLCSISPAMGWMSAATAASC